MLEGEHAPGGHHWFAGTRLNVAAHILRRGSSEAVAIVGTTEAVVAFLGTADGSRSRSTCRSTTHCASCTRPEQPACPRAGCTGHGGILLEMLKLQGLHRAIREKASPRHVPAGPPRGQPDTVDDPSLLDLFADLRAQRYPS